jgi:hypothetical protein
MPRSVMCSYGNCQETMSTGDYRVTVTLAGRLGVTDRQVFCCLEHAWRHLRKTDERHNGPRPEIETVSV